MAKVKNDGDGQVPFLLDILFDHKMSWIQELLREKEIATGGTKTELREKVEDCLEDESLQTSDLVDLLDRVEGWGNQHIYLYKADNKLIRTLSDEDGLKKTLRSRHLVRLFNGRIPLVLPENPALSAIEWSSDNVRFVWVEKREYREFRDDRSYTEGDLEFDAYELKRSRGIISFSCDLVTGLAELMIQRLPSGNDYLAEKDKYMEELAEVFDVTQLSLQKISRVIGKVDVVKKIRKRSCQWTTPHGSGATYTSRSRKESVYNDSRIKASRAALGQSAGGLGNYYWPIEERDIHVKLYSKDQRIGIFGECTEDEVKSVLSEIRGYC